MILKRHGIRWICRQEGIEQPHCPECNSVSADIKIESKYSSATDLTVYTAECTCDCGCIYIMEAEHNGP